jgi:hypothetical protein
LIGLLAALPLVRGGQQLWAALAATAGILTLITFAVLRSFATHAWPIVWSREDALLVSALLWAWVGLRLPAAPPEALGSFLLILGGCGTFWFARWLAWSGSALRSSSIWRPSSARFGAVRFAHF